MNAGPLAPGDRRLRRGRYEVAAYGPKHPETTARRLLAGPFRFADAITADRYAEEFAAMSEAAGHVDVIYIDRVAPRDVRYPEGPWTTTNVRQITPGTTANTQHEGLTR